MAHKMGEGIICGFTVQIWAEDGSIIRKVQAQPTQAVVKGSTRRGRFDSCNDHDFLQRGVNEEKGDVRK